MKKLLLTIFISTFVFVAIAYAGTTKVDLIDYTNGTTVGRVAIQPVKDEISIEIYMDSGTPETRYVFYIYVHFDVIGYGSTQYAILDTDENGKGKADIDRRIPADVTSARIAVRSKGIFSPEVQVSLKDKE